MHQALLVGADRLVAKEHALGDFLVASALSEKLQHHQFTVIDLSEKLQVVIDRLIVFDGLAGEIVIPGQHGFDCAEQFAQVFPVNFNQNWNS